MFSTTSLISLLGLLFFLSPLLAQELDSSSDLAYRSFDNEFIYELNSRSIDDELEFRDILLARAGSVKSSKSSSSLNTNKALPAVPKAEKKTPPPIAPKPAGLSAPKTEAGKAKQAAAAVAGPARSDSVKSSTGSASAGKGKEPAKEPYKAPNLLKENEKAHANKPVPDKQHWYQKVGDKLKSPFKSKDQKNYDRLYKDPNPSSTPNLKKMINKESEIMTGTKATTANLEKWAKPRYEAKLGRIKPQGDVANAELAIHNNKWKGPKDTLTAVSQMSGIAKNAGVPAIFRRGLSLEQQEKMLLARSLMERDLVDEDIWA